VAFMASGLNPGSDSQLRYQQVYELFTWVGKRGLCTHSLPNEAL
jgi:hypothetical protein